MIDRSNKGESREWFTTSAYRSIGYGPCAHAGGVRQQQGLHWCRRHDHRRRNHHRRGGDDDGSSSHNVVCCGRPTAPPVSMASGALWTKQRAIVKRIKDSSGACPPTEDHHRSEGSRSTSPCRASNTEGITDTEIEIGQAMAQSGTLASYGQIGKSIRIASTSSTRPAGSRTAPGSLGSSTTSSRTTATTRRARSPWSTS